MTIRTRILMALLIVAAVSSVAVIVSVRLTSEIGLLRQVELPMEQDLREVEVSLWEAIHAADAYKTTNDTAYRDLYYRQVNDVESFFAKYSDRLETGQEIANADRFEALWSRSRSLAERMIALSEKRGGDVELLYQRIDEIDDLIDYEMQTDMDRLGPARIDAEVALREVEVSIWEMAHAATLHTHLRIVNQEDTPGSVSAYEALMERQIGDVEQYWPIYRAIADPDAMDEAQTRFATGWDEAVLIGRRLADANIEIQSLYDASYLAIDAADDFVDYTLQLAIADRIASRDRAAARLQWLVIGIGVLCAIVAAGMAFYLSRMIARPIGQQVRALSAFAGGDHTVRLPETGQAEFSQLGSSFNAMAELVAKLIEQSERERQRAEDANTAKSDFLANMSHEIRTPMTAILGFLDLIDDQEAIATDPKHVERALKTVRANASHLLTVINDILDVSKIESGQMVVESIETDPVRICEEVASITRPRAVGKGIDLQLRYATPVPATLLSDPTRLRQVLLNLLGNAIKFTEHGRVTITVSCNPQAETFCIEVQDTGIGMSPEQRDTIARFDAFQQADASTTRRFGGTGLGLRISNAIAIMLGGGIEITSEQGVGSRFAVTVTTGSLGDVRFIAPEEIDARHMAEPVEQQGAADRGSKPSPLEGLQVLLVEDGPDNQRLISFHLKRAGAAVTLAENGRIAVDLLTQGQSPLRPDVVFMDMQMPEMDGYQATRELRGCGLIMPIIALTAHAMDGDRKKCIDAGCDDYATKPIDPKRLIEQCRAHAIQGDRAA